MSQTFYEILGLSETASVKDIKRAYKKLAMECHPDLNPDDPQAEERFKTINEAYETLSNPGKRADYDRRLKEGPVSESQSNPADPFAADRERAAAYRPKKKPVQVINRHKEHRNRVFVILGICTIFMIGPKLFDLMNEYASGDNYTKARIAFLGGDCDNALEMTGIALQQDPSNHRASYLAGLIEADCFGSPYRATAYFYNATMNCRKPTADYFYRLGKARLAARATEDAVKNFREAYALYGQTGLAGESADLADPVFADVVSSDSILFNLAETELYERKKFFEAEAVYTEIIRLDSTKAAAYLGRGIAQFQLADYEASGNNLVRAGQLDSQNGVVYYYLAKINLEHTKDTTNALIGFEDAANLGVREAELMLKKLQGKTKAESLR